MAERSGYSCDNVDSVLQWAGHQEGHAAQDGDGKMTVTKPKQRHIRAHALRPGDQVEYGGKGKWWVVDRALEPGEVVTWTDKMGEQSFTVPSWVTVAQTTALLIRRGSRRTGLLVGRNVVVKILRG